MILQQADKVRGTVRVPGDKSIAHRALILGAMARGKQVIEGVPRAADVDSTISCLRSLGAFIEEMPDGRVLNLSTRFTSGKVLDAGNSGTTARLMSGLIAGHPLYATIDGDASLRRRPMTRVASPLTEMGAEVSTAEGGRLPMTIRGGNLAGMTYRLPVPSAQVKTAVLIAGLLADGETTVEEGIATRDHTERMLRAMSASIRTADGCITVEGGKPLKAAHVKVPADISSAAFFVVAATCLPSSEVYLPTTGVNPTRTGLLDVLQEMGASIDRAGGESYLEEPVADLIVKSSLLRGVTVDPGFLPRLIDELPVLAVAATQAEGETVVTGAEELRYKESDRITAVVDNLSLLGADIEERDDGFVVRGPTRLRANKVSSYGDHRIAMAMTVAGLLAEGRTEITGSEVIDVSYPSFFNDLRSLLR
ncbi:MAG: 3-phosphoshikimate 1-carboxyvinyltransferase [Candidatus Krumholzibacteriia bacterium]